MDIASEAVVDELQTNEGIIHTFNAWKINSAGGVSRKQYFLNQLKKSLSSLTEKSSTDLSNLAIIISGMASSSIGLHELPYVDLPFAINGSQAGVQIFAADDNFRHRIILISGVKGESDVARGEETQLIGLIKLLNLDANTEAVFVLPGTHSKHLTIKQGKLIGIQTFMTGELYNILVDNSILKDSVDVDIPGDLHVDEREAFVAGVRNSASSNILNSLFTVRTNQLFNKLDKKQNALYLSGLLIGNELNGLISKNVSLILCSDNALHKLYKLAFEYLGLLDRTTIVPADLLSRATIAGQIIIAQNHNVLYEDK